MITNCPLAYDECDAICRHYQGTTCGYYRHEPPRPLSEILTAHERLDRVDGVLTEIDNNTPWSNRQWEYVKKLRTRCASLERELTYFKGQRKYKNYSTYTNE